MLVLLIWFALQADAVKPGTTGKSSQWLPTTTSSSFANIASTKRIEHCLIEVENFWQHLRAAGVQVPDNGHQTDSYEIGTSRAEAKFLMEFASAYLPQKTEESPPVICQSGFNYGTSAFAFLCGSTDANARVISWDLGSHEYVAKASEQIQFNFPRRHTLVLGDSRNTIPAFPHASHCDIVFVDGGHDQATALADIRNFGSIAKPAAVIIVDDCRSEDGSPASRAWDEATDKMIVAASLHHHEFEGGRSICLGNYHKNLVMSGKLAKLQDSKLQVTNTGHFLSFPRSVGSGSGNNNASLGT